MNVDTAIGLAPVGNVPSLKRRMACFVYEGMMLFGIGLVPGAIGAMFTALTGHTHPLQSDTSLRVIAYVIYGVYFTWFWSSRGQTLPMQTWNIKLVTLSGHPLSQRQALMRYLASSAWFVPAVVIAQLNHWSRWDALLAVTVGVVGYALLTLLHPQRQFWHDALCGTQIIDAPPVKKRR
jgi:uncharacterized RDD family membrane protein YckC